jgi:hypothetical protein
VAVVVARLVRREVPLRPSDRHSKADSREPIDVAASVLEERAQPRGLGVVRHPDLEQAADHLQVVRVSIPQ